MDTRPVLVHLKGIFKQTLQRNYRTNTGNLVVNYRYNPLQPDTFWDSSTDTEEHKWSFGGWHNVITWCSWASMDVQNYVPLRRARVKLLTAVPWSNYLLYWVRCSKTDLRQKSLEPWKQLRKEALLRLYGNSTVQTFHLVGASEVAKSCFHTPLVAFTGCESYPEQFSVITKRRRIFSKDVFWWTKRRRLAKKYRTSFYSSKDVFMECLASWSSKRTKVKKE